MFEKAKPFNALSRARFDGERSAGQPARRAGDALRALEWGELTARLNAARDLRLLLRTESHAPIEPAAASFGDAAASYFALLGDSEPVVNPDSLDQSKGLGATIRQNQAKRPDAGNGHKANPPRSDAREVQ